MKKKLLYLLFIITFGNTIIFGYEKIISKKQEELKTTESIVTFLWSHGSSACSFSYNIRDKDWINLNWTKLSYQYIKNITNEVISVVLSIIVFLFELLFNLAVLLAILAIFFYGFIVCFISIFFGVFVFIWDLAFGT